MGHFSKIFMSYDIRGIVPDELDESVAEAIGAAFARLTAPLGWDVVRLPVHPEEPVPTQADDLEALANAVREAAPAGSATEPVGQGVEVSRRGHQRVLRSDPAEPRQR